MHWFDSSTADCLLSADLCENAEDASFKFLAEFRFALWMMRIIERPQKDTS